VCLGCKKRVRVISIIVQFKLSLFDYDIEEEKLLHYSVQVTFAELLYRVIFSSG
jgi:hypothetical protein